jgi:hypothetical protein
MTNLSDLTTSQLRKIVAIKEQIEALQSRLDSIAAGDGEIPTPATLKAPKKRRMSRAGRAAIAAAQQARWAKLKGKAKRGKSRLIAAAKAVVIASKEATAKPAKKKDRRSSPAVRAKLAAAAKARWAKVRAEGKKTL